VYKLFKQIDKSTICKNKYNLENDYDMLIWLLEGTIKDYEMIKAERSEVYYRLRETYNTLTEKDICKTENTFINLENIINLENNVELCNKINNNIKNIFQQYDNMKSINSHYMLALFIDINKYIRLLNIHFTLYLE
jgi:tetrahydrodipicolinate N-succinyltransferase